MLSLTALALHRVAAEQHLEVVAVDAVERVAYSTVLVAVASDGIKQRTASTVRHIVERNSLVFVRDAVVDVLEHRDELSNEGIAFLVDGLSVHGHLLLPNIHEGCVWLVVLLQKGIALLQGFVIGRESFDVGMVVLRDDKVKESPAFVARSLNKGGVGG